MDREYVLAQDITDCSECPLDGEECRRACSGSPSSPYNEPPCASWSDDDEIYAGMMDDAYEYAMEMYLLREKEERSYKAKKAAKTRKQYEHLNPKIDAFKEWLKKSNYTLVFSSRKKDRIYLRKISNKNATFYYDIAKDKLYYIANYSNNIFSRLDMQSFCEKFANDFIEYYTGVRPEDHDYANELMSDVMSSVNEMFK